MVDIEENDFLRLRDPNAKPKFLGPGMFLEPIHREMVKKMRRPEIDPVTGPARA